MRRLSSLLIALLLILPLPGWSLTVVIKNQNGVYPDSQVYFSFRDAPVNGTINGQALVQDHCYSVADIGSGINLQSAGGRVYFSLGVPLIGTGDPEFINSSVQNYYTRFDKMELTFSQTDHSGVADLTAIDFFAIPLAVKTYAAATASGTPLQTLTFHQPANTIISYLAALTNSDPTVLLKDQQGNFLRVLGPSKAQDGKYPSFAPYINSVRAAGQSTHITGLYSHLPDSTRTTTQNYDFVATFDGSGNLVLNGGGTSYAGGATVGPGHVVVLTAANLATGIYGANPPYTVDGAAGSMGDNDVYSAVVRDGLTGYALGFVNSATVDPNTGVAFKGETSDHWWASPQAFGYLQPNNPTYYSQYAAYLQTISNAYGHPFSDRWQVVQASLDPTTVGTMEIDVLPDAGAPAITSAASATAQAGLTFSYQIAATNSPTGFGASGLPAGLSVNTSTGLISGAPSASGVFASTLSATNASGTGNLALALTVDNRFSAWQASNFTTAEMQNANVSGPSGDATGAGVANLIKYALGIPPKRAGVAGLPTASVQNTGGPDYLFFVYTYNPLASDATPTVQVSSDLRTWNSGVSYTTEISRVSNADGTRTVTTRGNTPIGNGAARQFMRLSVSLAGN